MSELDPLGSLDPLRSLDLLGRLEHIQRHGGRLVWVKTGHEHDFDFLPEVINELREQEKVKPLKNSNLEKSK